MNDDDFFVPQVFTAIILWLVLYGWIASWAWSFAPADWRLYWWSVPAFFTTVAGGFFPLFVVSAIPLFFKEKP